MLNTGTASVAATKIFRNNNLRGKLTSRIAHDINYFSDASRMPINFQNTAKIFGSVNDMEIWEVTKFSATLTKSALKSSHGAGQNVASEYSQILAEKISNVRADVEAMAEVREQLDEICAMHEELTGDVKVDEDSGNANRDDDAALQRFMQTETIKRFLPDGTIMITTYEGSRIVEQVKHKPHMVSVPDYTAPPNPDGTVATKLEPRQSLDLAMLLMM